MLIHFCITFDAAAAWTEHMRGMDNADNGRKNTFIRINGSLHRCKHIYYTGSVVACQSMSVNIHTEWCLDELLTGTARAKEAVLALIGWLYGAWVASEWVLRFDHTISSINWSNRNRHWDRWRPIALQLESNGDAGRRPKTIRIFRAPSRLSCDQYGSEQ